jgi:hypothetical protein
MRSKVTHGDGISTKNRDFTVRTLDDDSNAVARAAATDRRRMTVFLCPCLDTGRDFRTRMPVMVSVIVLALRGGNGSDPIESDCPALSPIARCIRTCALR